MDPNAQTPTVSTPELTQPVENTPPEKNKPKLSKKVILVISVIVISILLLGSVAGIYWYSNNSSTTKENIVSENQTPTPDPTASWDTYKNDAFGYTFNYPEGYEITDLGERDMYINRIGVPVGGQGGNQPFGSMIFYYRGVEGLENQSEIRRESVVLDTTVNGFPAKQVKSNSSLQYSISYYISDLNNKRVIKASIGTGGDTGYEESSFNTFNQILSTFKFINYDAGTKTPSDWKTYSDFENEYSIKYPPGWRIAEDDNWVGFGTPISGEDTAWTLSVYNKSDKNITEIIDDVGDQFTDRKQINESIIVNGTKATRVTTTTAQVKDWYSVIVIFESDDKLYALSNGATYDVILNSPILQLGEGYDFVSFQDFFSSFKIIK